MRINKLDIDGVFISIACHLSASDMHKNLPKVFLTALRQNAEVARFAFIKRIKTFYDCLKH